MAIGDISAELDQEYLDNEAYYVSGAHRGGDVFVCVYGTAGSNYVEIRAIKVANDGTITLTDSWNTTTSVYTQYVCHIAGNVFALWYSDRSTQAGIVRTFAVDSNGTITKSWIQTLTFASGSFPEDVWLRYKPVYTGNNIWLMATQASYQLKIWSVQISDDGATLTEKDVITYSMPQNKGIAMAQANGTIYAVYSEQLVESQYFWTFECDSSGNLTAKDSHSFGNVSAGNPGMAHITDGVILISRYNGWETWSVAANGTIGSKLDTLSAGELQYFAALCDDQSGDHVIVYQSGDTMYTRAVSDGGIIGDVIDTLDMDMSGLGVFDFIQGETDSEMWVSFTPASPTFNLFATSFTIEGAPDYWDRIYVWLGDSAEDEGTELTDPDYSMVLAARTERGWDEELAQATAGIAELTCDNFYGDFNPENAGGQYYGNLALGKWITVFEVYDGVKYKHFTGKIQKILPNDDPNDPTAYILAADGMDDIAGVKVSTVLRQDTDVGELADDALNACNWAAGKRDIDTGVDTLEFGWFHKKPGLDAFRDLETTEKGRFFIKRDGDARFENRHYRITGDGLVSQATFDDTAVRIGYEWSKRLLYNDIQVTGRRYYAGGVQLFSGYDLATLDASLVWSAHTGDAAAPYIPQATTVVIWAEFAQPLSSYDTLVKGTHWNANTEPDKSGTDVSDNITITETQYGQAVKLEIENTGTMGAYIVEPDSPPDPTETEDRTLLIYGVLFGSENLTFIEEDTDSQEDYGKRTLEIDAPFKSRPNDILAYTQWLLARYYLPIPNPVQVIHVARTNWPDDTIRIQCLTREISDRITVSSTKLGFDRDFYINKVIQEYAINEGGMVHETTWVVEQAEGSAEGLYWLLGVAGFGELGEATKLGF